MSTDREAAMTALLLRTFHNIDGVTDEMTYAQSRAASELYDELVALGIDPYAEVTK